MADDLAYETILADKCFREVAFQGDGHKAVYSRVRELRKLCTNLGSVFYSPYSAFVQSSGVGKTRSVLEMSKLGVYVCYCSLAGKSSSAYPPRTEFLADKLASSFTELEMILYLKAWLIVLAEAVKSNVTPVAWKEMQLPGGTLAKSVHDRWVGLVSTYPVANYGGNKDLANASIMQDILEELGTHFTSNQGEDDMVTDEEDVVTVPLVVFVFDEARGLQQETTVPATSPFHQIRRALRVFFEHEHYFALMLDTAARLSNLLPKKGDEDSARAVFMGTRLIPPIYYLPSLPLYAPMSGRSLAEIHSPATWMKYGRPLWAARMANEGQAEGTLRSKLLQLALQKLMGGTLSEGLVTGGVMTDSQAMALLAAATGLQVSPRCPLAEKLAASHMNLVLRVTDDRERVFVSLPAEPILSEAAATLFRAEQVKVKALQHLEDACLEGYATGGPRGEFVAKFILVAAVWHLAEKKTSSWYLHPVPVESFLRELLVYGKSDPETKAAFRKVASRLPAGGTVFFNSFVVVGKVPNVAMLGKCYAGGHAIMYQADNTMPGADIIVPSWTPVGMTAVVLSVKNITNPSWLEKASQEALRSEFTKVEVAPGLTTVTVLLSMQEPAVAQPKAWLMWDDPHFESYLQLSCYGMDNNYAFLSKEVKGLLKKILVTRMDPLKGASDREQEWIKNMLPYQYGEVPSFHFS